jgi:putative PEP-CTERM system histidine kinase
MVLAMTVAAALVIPSARARAWLRVILAKHLFEHRYDYREEWLRFARAVSIGGQDTVPIGERVVKALADMAGSPGGLLLVGQEGGLLAVEAQWQWNGSLPARPIEAAALTAFLERAGHVVDFASPPDEAEAISSLARMDGWAGIPLLHRERLVGVVILNHPLIRRRLDWEDIDLFRTAGIQAATYLAEARTQEALANAQRFDEFNRRFAFILHDIKNLVSQLSLVARNAERHAHNPAFREDMIATLQSSVKKMNELLARLSPSRPADAEPPRPTRLIEVVEAVTKSKQRVHPITVGGDAELVGLADAAGLEQALSHLVQNAVDASGPGSPVEVAIRCGSGEALVEVHDRGAGMSADFIRSRLFQPFASTKDGGFGVGAFEARALIAAMNGRLEVRSREGEGSCFTVCLPLAATSASYSDQRMCA